MLRYYWCFLMLNTFTSLAVMTTFKRARCQCTSYWQCEVLYGYMGTEKHEMINPFPQPYGERFEKFRSVPYSDPPVSLAEAERLWLEERANARKAIVSPISPGTKLLQIRDNELKAMPISRVLSSPDAADSTSMLALSEQQKRLWRKAKALKASNFGSGLVLSTNLSHEAVIERSRVKSLSLASALKEKFSEKHTDESSAKKGKKPKKKKSKAEKLKDCCKVVLKYQIQPGRIMPRNKEVNLWWDQTGCDDIVKDAGECEALLSDDDKKGKDRSDSETALDAHTQTASSEEADTSQDAESESGPLSHSTLKYYDISKSNVDWMASPHRQKDTKCTSYSEESLGNAAVMADALSSIRNQRAATVSADAPELFETIVGRMNHCRRKHICGIVRIAIKAESTKDVNGTQVITKARLHICLLKYPVVPMKAVPSKIQGEDILIFQKNRKQVIKFEQERKGVDRRGSALMKRVLPLPMKKAHEQLADHFLDSCRCSSPQPNGKEGCQVYYNNNSNPVHWCEVAPLSLTACRQIGMKLFYSAETGGYWTVDLCERSSCACSNIGTPPTSMGNADMELMASLTPAGARDTDGVNPLLYGTDCHKWNKADTQPWCYVGYDSICPDREKISGNILIPAHRRAPTIPGSVSQYKSTFACVSQVQNEAILTKKDRCQVYVALPVTLLGLLTIASLMMIVVVYKFLIRRCGDHFAVEQQFEAYFSESSGEEADDFDVNPKRMPSKSVDFGDGMNASKSLTSNASTEKAEESFADDAAASFPSEGKPS